MPDGPWRIDDRKIVPPPKDEIVTSMESLIHHFKLFTEGLKPPVGEVYSAIEGGPRGDGVLPGERREREAVSVPHACAVVLQPAGAAAGWRAGTWCSDMIAIIGSIDIVLGEVDR